MDQKMRTGPVPCVLSGAMLALLLTGPSPGTTAAPLLSVTAAGAARTARQAPDDASFAGFDVYGSERIDTTRVEEEVGDEIRAFARAYLAGDLEQARRLAERIRERLHETADLAWVGISPVQYFDEGNPMYLTVDLVDAEDAAERMDFLPEPEGQVDDPAGLLERWRAYEQLSWKLARAGEIEMQVANCPAFHCVLGFDHPELEPFLELFERQVPQHEEQLTRVLTEDADAEDRATAAFLLAHLDDADRLVGHLLPRVRDPAEGVRNNVMRVLALLVTGDADVRVDPGPILAALEFPATTDRNKALAVLNGLASREGYRERILREAGLTLVDLLELKQPNNHDFAYQILRTLSGLDLGERDHEAWRRWVRDRTDGAVDAAR